MTLHIWRDSTYYLTAIDANDEVVPRFNGDFEVLVAQDLETIWRAIPGALGRTFRIEARDEAIQRSKHGTHGCIL